MVTAFRKGKDITYGGRQSPSRSPLEFGDTNSKLDIFITLKDVVLAEGACCIDSEPLDNASRVEVVVARK